MSTAERHFPETLEAQFRASRARTIADLNSSPFHFGLSAVMVLLFSGWDWMIDPAHWSRALVIRCLAAAVIVTTGLIARATHTTRWAVVIAKVRFSAAVLAVAGANAVLDNGYLYGMPGLVAAFLGGPYIVLDRRDYLTTTLLPLTGVAVVMSFASIDRFTIVNTWIFLGLTFMVGLMLVRAFEATHRRAFALEQALSREARTDALTGLANRRSMEEMAVQELRRQVRGRQATAFVLCDIDHFKRINDEFGHDAGDRTIRQVGDQLRAVLRGSDCVGRWGGEEFLVILPETSEEEATKLAERMRLAVAALPGSPLSMPVQVSLGVAALTHDGTQPETDTFESALKLADAALYRAKQQGRNRVIASTMFDEVTVAG